jgi:Zn-dependent protease with chaperone function
VTGWLGTLALAALAASTFAAATALAVAFAHPWLRRGLSRSHPAARADAELVAALAPAALAACGLALCFAPSALALLRLGADHCLRHAEHPHLCLLHHGFAPTPLLSLGLAVGASVAAVGLARAARREARGRRWLARLVAAPGGAFAPGVRVVQSEAAFCFTAGFLRPRIYLSAAFARALPPAQLAAALEHERAHARRRDALRLWLARALAWVHLPAVRARVLADLALACEQACDEEAGRRLGDRLRVAEAILAAERALAGAPPIPALAAAGFGHGSTAARVQSLLAEPRRPAPGTLRRLLLASLLLAAPAAADPLHHATEHLLGLLLRAL